MQGAGTLVKFGFLLQWPTIPTVIMFSILVIVYLHLARHGKRLARQESGQTYLDYMRLKPAWIPKFFPTHSSNLEGDQIEHYR